jgi:hypothetical protein
LLTKNQTDRPTTRDFKEPPEFDILIERLIKLGVAESRRTLEHECYLRFLLATDRFRMALIKALHKLTDLPPCPDHSEAVTELLHFNAQKLSRELHDWLLVAQTGIQDAYRLMRSALRIVQDDIAERHKELRHLSPDDLATWRAGSADQRRKMVESIFAEAMGRDIKHRDKINFRQQMGKIRALMCLNMADELEAKVNEFAKGVEETCTAIGC